MKSFIGLILWCLVVLLHGQTESIFWKIEGKGLSQPSYLFGTYHMINHGFLEKEAPKVQEVYLNADQVIIESVMIDSVDQLVLQRHIFSDLSVHELLSEEEYNL